jgi:HK97 family phage major capsid protein
VPYNSLTSRTDSEALIPEEVSRAFLDRARTQSAVLTQFRRVPIAGRQNRFPVLSALPVAYWVGGDTGLKQTTEMAWSNKFLTVEEAATIVPIPENVVDDLRDSGNYDVWGEVEPDIVEAIGRLVDAAVFFGSNAPGTFPTNIQAAAIAAGNVVTEGNTAAEGGFFGDIDETISTVEDDGYDVSGFVAARSARGRFRAARNSQGDRLDGNRLNGTLSELDGLAISYPMRGLFPVAVGGTTPSPGTRLFAGDWTQFVVGLRQDVTFKLLTEAVIQDNTGAIVYNLAQQDMVAMRVKIRLGWQVANLINYDRPTESARYPVGVLQYNA